MVTHERPLAEDSPIASPPVCRLEIDKRWGWRFVKAGDLANSLPPQPPRRPPQSFATRSPLWESPSACLLVPCFQRWACGPARAGFQAAGQFRPVFDTVLVPASQPRDFHRSRTETSASPQTLRSLAKTPAGKWNACRMSSSLSAESLLHEVRYSYKPYSRRGRRPCFRRVGNGAYDGMQGLFFASPPSDEAISVRSNSSKDLADQAVHADRKRTGRFATSSVTARVRSACSAADPPETAIAGRAGLHLPKRCQRRFSPLFLAKKLRIRRHCRNRTRAPPPAGFVPATATALVHPRRIASACGRRSELLGRDACAPRTQAQLGKSNRSRPRAPPGGSH